jgi:trimethylamine--corrinoid protein Co-methyltransferase
MIESGGLRLAVLSPQQMTMIHEATVEVLEETGVVIGAPEVIDLLTEHGARADGDVVRIPGELVARALDTAPAAITVFDRVGSRELDVGGDNVYFGGWLENMYVHDPETGDLRSPVIADVDVAAIVCDSLPNLDWFSWGGQISDEPPLIREPMIYRRSLPFIRKPCVANAVDEDALNDIIDMAAVMAGGDDELRSRPILVATAEPMSPLQIAGPSARKLLICGDRGIPICFYPMPAAGSSAPAFPVGPVVVGNIEVLSGLVIHQLNAPGAPFVYGNIPSLMDMKSMSWSYGAPELVLALSAMTDLGHWYGLPVYGTAGCGDSMETDGQLGAEFALSIHHAMLSRANLVHDPGVFGAGVCAGAETLVFADEIIGMVEHLARGMVVDAETLATEVIREIGPRGSYLTHPTTIGNFRSFWYPKVFFRDSPEAWDGPETNRSLRERLRDRISDLVAAHTDYEIDDDRLAALAEIETRMRARAAD